MDFAQDSNGTSGRPPTEAPRRASSEADKQLGSLLEQAAQHVVALVEKAGELAALSWKRLHLRAVDATYRVALVATAIAAGVTIVISASLLLVSGTCAALARWSQSEWVGDLGGGAIALSLPFLVLTALRWSSRRTLLEKALRRRVRPSAAPAAAATVSPVTADAMPKVVGQDHPP